MKKYISPAPICAGLAFLAPGLSIYLPLALATLLVVAAALLIAARVAGNRETFTPVPSVAAALAALAILALVSDLWTINPHETLSKVPRLVLILLSGGIVVWGAAALPPKARSSMARWTLGGIFLAAVALAFERLTGGFLMSFAGPQPDQTAFLNLFNRGLTVCAVLAWSGILWATRSRAWFGLLAFVVMAGLMLAFDTDAAVVAMAAGAATFGLIYAWPRTFGRIFSIVAVLAVFAAPLVHNQLPPPKALLEGGYVPRSTYHRLLIWDFTSDRIAERPVLGWGFNSSRVIPGRNRQLDTFEVALPLHPHNGALQLWLELGIGGALVGAALILAATEGARRYSAGRLEQATASAAIASALVVVLVSYGIWQSWWMAALFIAAAVTIPACRRAPETAGTAAEAGPRR